MEPRSRRGLSAKTGSEGEHDELLRALDGRLAREVGAHDPEDLFGRRRVAADWHPNGDLRAKARRRIRKALAIMG